MSLQDDTDFDNQDDDTEQQQPRMVQMSRKDIRALEKKANAAATAETRAQTAEAELSIFRAGFTDLNERQTKALLSSVGDDRSVESFKTAAADLWPDRYGTSNEDQEADAEAQQHQRLSSTLAGGQPGAGGKVTPTEAADAALSTATRIPSPEEQAAWVAAYAANGGATSHNSGR